MFITRSEDSMNTRMMLLDYCVRHQLDASTVKALWRLAGFNLPPPSLILRVRIGLAAISALLLGAALTCWVAANWSGLSRTIQFGILEVMVLLPCVGAAILPRLRTALAVFAFIAIGSLFAYFGQTYQTGADPWELFALWSGLGLPLVLTVRTEPLRVLWIVVAFTAIGLWTNNANNLFHYQGSPNAVFGSVSSLLIALSLSKPFRRYTAAGPYSSGVAITAALVLACITALPGIVDNDGRGTATFIGFLILLLAMFYTRAASFDIVALCACALALNFLIDTAVVFATLSQSTQNVGGTVFIIGVVACSLCGASVAAILSVMRSQAPYGGPHE